MFKVTVVDMDRESHEHEGVIGYTWSDGVLVLKYGDGSSTMYNQGAWLEATVERVDNPQVVDYQI